MRMGETVQINYSLGLQKECLTVSVVPIYYSPYVILLLFMWYLYQCIYSVKYDKFSGF